MTLVLFAAAFVFDRIIYQEALTELHNRHNALKPDRCCWHVVLHRFHHYVVPNVFKKKERHVFNSFPSRVVW